MIKKIVFYLCLLICLLTYSCSDSVNQNTSFQEKGVLYCILNADTTFQTAYLSRNYGSSDNKADPSLDSAIVSLTVNGNKIYTFYETSTVRKDTSRYTSIYKYYAVNNYKPNDEDNVTILALLKNGKILTSTITTPPCTGIYFKTIETYYDPKPGNSKGIYFSWIPGGDIRTLNHVYYAPKLEIVYAKASDPSNKIKIAVPKYFIPENGYPNPIYPRISSDTSIVFWDTAIDSTMSLISKGDANKNNYIIYSAQFTLLILEKNLASYISAQETFQDEISTRIDAADITNISNGLGIFGAYSSKKFTIKISGTYITSFGYRFK